MIMSDNMTREVFFDDKICMFCDTCDTHEDMTLIKGTEKTEITEEVVSNVFKMSAKYVCKKCKTQYLWKQTFVQNADVGGETFEKDNSAARDKCIDAINRIMDEYDEALGAFRLAFMNDADDDMEKYFHKIKSLRSNLNPAKVNLVSLFRSCKDCDYHDSEDNVCTLADVDIWKCCEKGVCKEFSLNHKKLDDVADEIIKCAKLEEE